MEWIPERDPGDPPESDEPVRWNAPMDDRVEAIRETVEFPLVEIETGADHQIRCPMLSNLAYCDKKASLAVPVGPLRCLATITSARPRRSGDASAS